MGTNDRTFQRTHPWLKFEIDLRRASPKLWLALGEAQSKCAHVAGTPLAPGLADELFQVYMAKGVAATTAIEGNTLTEQQVRERLAGRRDLPASLAYQGKEIDNVVEAINLIGTRVIETGQRDITIAELKEFNRLVLRDIPQDEGGVPGEIPRFNVTVGRYLAPPREDCEYLIEKLCAWLNGDTFSAPKGNEIVYAILRAVVAHLYFAWIHPFADGNGRTARLLEFKILLAAGVSAASAHLLSNHYNQTRPRYYRELDTASRNGGDILPFLEYAIEGFVDGLREQIELIRTSQWRDTWINHVHTAFRDRHDKAALRQRDLVLDLAETSNPVPRNALRKLSERVAVAYSGMSDRTLARDLADLHELSLIDIGPDGYTARRGVVLAMLPPRVGRK